MTVRRLFVAALVLAAAALALASPATDVAAAAPIKECGRAGTLYGGHVALYNVTSRNVACRRARRFARNFTYYGGPETDFACSEDRYCSFRGWACRNVAYPGETDHRCTNSLGRVVRWQEG